MGHVHRLGVLNYEAAWNVAFLRFSTTQVQDDQNQSPISAYYIS